MRSSSRYELGVRRSGDSKRVEVEHLRDVQAALRASGMPRSYWGIRQYKGEQVEDTAQHDELPICE